MSTAIGEPGAGGAQKYVNFDEYVEFQVNKTRAGIRYTDLLLAVVTVLLVGAGYLLLFVIADHWLVDGGFSDGTRTALLSGVVAFMFGWTIWKIVLPYWKRVTALYAARELESSQPQLKSSLLTLVDLKRAGRDVSPHILTAMEKRAALQLSQIDVEQAVDRRPLMRLAIALFGVLLAFCLYTVFSPKPIGPSLLRALIPIADVGVATRTRIVKVDPGATSILARSQLRVIVDLEGEIPPEATLLYTTADHSLVDEPVVLRDTGEGLHRFQGTLSGPNGRGLLQDFRYRVAAGDAESETFAVTVEQAPYATVESVSYAYPAYMGLDAKTQSSGDIDAWEGTQVTLRGSTNMPVAGATLKFHDTEDTSIKGEELLMRLVDETHFEATWTLQFRSDGTFAKYYRIDLRTEAGKRDPVPRLYTQSIRRDLPPEITLLHPTGDLELPANAVLPLSFTARDPDFMLRSIRLRFEQREQAMDAKTRHLYDAPPHRSELSGRSELKLSEFKLQPGDVLTFYLEAWDNMSPLGQKEGNRTVTPKINIAIAAEATREEVDQLHEEAAQAAQDRLDEAQAQENAERGEQEPSGDGQSGDEPQADPADGNQTGDTESNPGEQAGGEQQNAPGTDDGEPAGTPDEGNSAQPQPQPAGEQTNDPAEQSPQDQQQQQQQQQQAGGDGQSGQRSQAGKAQSPNNGANQPGDQQGHSGSQPGQKPQPGQEASDDEALAKLLDKYKEQIKQEQQKQQQNDQQQPQDRGEQGPSENSQSGEQQGSRSQQRQQSGDSGASNSETSAGDSESAGSEDSESSGSGARRSEGSKPKGERTIDNSQSDANAGGDAPQPESGDPEGQSPSQKTPAGENAGQAGAKSEPDAQQDPRTAEPNDRQRGDSPDGAKPNDRSESTGSDNASDATAAQPMTGDGNPSKSASPAGETPPGEPRQPAGAQPSGEQPTGEDPTGEPQPAEQPQDAANPSADPPPENPAAKSQGEPQQPGEQEPPKAREPDSAKRSQTGDQPQGADEPNPGEGRKGGQRAEQSETGEEGSSSKTSEGQSSNESGAGDASKIAGSKSAGKSGQQQAGAGKPAGENQKGQQQPGGGEESQTGDEGTESGQEPGDQPAGSEGAGGKSPSPSGESQSGSDKGKQGQDQGGKSGSESSPPGEQPPPGGEPGQKGAAGQESETGDQQQPGEKGAGGEQDAGEEQPSGEQPSGGGKPGDKQQSGEKGSGEQGGKEGGGKEGGGKEGGGKEGGGEQGEGGGQEGGGEAGGEQSGGGESKQPGNSQQGGQPGTGQPTGGAVGSGGRGQSEGATPPGSGGSGGSDAGPAAPADLSDRKRATELVLQKLQDELSRGEVSPELLQDLGWTEQNLRDFMDRLDRRLSDTGEDQSPEAEARRRQFNEILRGIDYQSAGQQKTADPRDRPVSSGAGPTPRLPAPSEFRGVEESFRQKLSRETKSK